MHRVNPIYIYIYIRFTPSVSSSTAAPTSIHSYEHSKAFARTWYCALIWYSLHLSSPRTHSKPWNAVGTRGRVSRAAR